MFIENGGQNLLFSMMKDRLGKREGEGEMERGRERDSISVINTLVDLTQSRCSL